MEQSQFEFDVFLCHNSKDKPAVIQIAEQLKQREIRPWLDIWELRPGFSWQDLLEQQISQIGAVAVFVGGSGFGPWQYQEINAFLRQFVRRQCPVIPVLLWDAPTEPQLPIFLEGLTWVDFRIQQPEPMEQLIWGITGQRPSQIREQPATIREQIVNPFGYRGRITDPKRFFNREELLRQIFEELNKGSNLSLVGETQIGKSSILEMICRWGPERLQLPQEAFIYLDMQIIHTEHEFFEALCEELKIDNCRGYKLSRALRNKRHILCLDEIEKMTRKEHFTGDERSELRGLAGATDSPLSLVIASRSPLKDLFEDSSNETSPLAGVCNQLDVKPFTLETVRSFISQNLRGTGVMFTESQIQELFANSKGHPQRLQEAAYELFRRLTQS